KKLLEEMGKLDKSGLGHYVTPTLENQLSKLGWRTALKKGSGIGLAATLGALMSHSLLPKTTGLMGELVGGTIGAATAPGLFRGGAIKAATAPGDLSKAFKASY